MNRKLAKTLCIFIDKPKIDSNSGKTTLNVALGQKTKTPLN